jgi:alcohol dehydrogenase class IV
MLNYLKEVTYRLRALLVKLVGQVLPQPSPMLFCGSGSLAQLENLIAESECNHLMIVTDKVIVSLGFINSLRKTLLRYGKQMELFDSVEPDPSDAVIIEGVNQYISTGCDGVLGIGGGSSLDAAKMISALAHSNKPIEKLVGMLKMKAPRAPLYLVPTTAGTGSEVTMVAVVTISSSNKKAVVVDPKLIPDAVALDPELMTGLPPNITAMTGVDALTHGIEAFLSKNATPATDKYAVMAIKLILKHLPRVYADGGNVESRMAMSLASYYAGWAFSRAGLGYVHGIAHQLGTKYHIPHGLANGLVLPRVLDFYQQEGVPRLTELARLTADQHSNDLITGYIGKIRQLLADVGFPSFMPQLDLADIPLMVKDALTESHNLHPVPVYLSTEQCTRLIEKVGGSDSGQDQRKRN